MAGQIPVPSERYSAGEEQRRNQQIENLLANRLERFADFEVISTRIILTSPNGTRYSLIVNDAGVIGTVAI